MATTTNEVLENSSVPEEAVAEQNHEIPASEMPNHGNNSMAKQQDIVPPKLKSRYEEIMEALSKPVSSYTLLYEPHLVPESTPARKKRSKAQFTPRNILANVTTLIRTGMLYGVAVRYINKTHQIELGGIIKGASYLCGCKSCNYTKAVNAYEFEHHAGCKTSHPNNHIHFENGKSMHMAVQLLKNTPEDNLYNAVRTVLGICVDKIAFSTWKATDNPFLS